LKKTVPKKIKPNWQNYDIYILARAVSEHETKNCKLWYWKIYNNCFWIKNWWTVPCNKIWRNRMCIYNTPKESYDAFKIIRETWYDWLPNLEKAKRWSWNDRAEIWLKNVLNFYNKSI